MPLRKERSRTIMRLPDNIALLGHPPGPLPFPSEACTFVTPQIYTWQLFLDPKDDTAQHRKLDTACLILGQRSKLVHL